MGEKALIETQLAALLNICKAEEVDDRADLAVVHLPGSLSDSFHQHLGLPRAIFSKENPENIKFGISDEISQFVPANEKMT